MKSSDDSSLQRGRALETFCDLPSMQEERAEAKAAFRAQFQRTQAYQLLSPLRRYQTKRLENLEEACWNFRCAEARKGLKGAGAGRALSLLLNLRRELREPTWLPDHVSVALDTLQDKLQHLASNRPQGRPRDSLGQTFRRNMWVFLWPGVLLKDGYRALSQPKIDEVLNELFKVAIGRALSLDSYVRMRKREQAVENRDISASSRRRAILRSQKRKGTLGRSRNERP
ncbi:MAG: hypothetical protein ACREQR_12270 [Candidatus Binataceae bacterium]